MKRIGNLWLRVVDIDNIKAAHRQARKGKAYYTEVKMVDSDIDKYALEIQEMLVNKTFTTGTYVIEQRKDKNKIRTICKLPYYPDRIVQHALLNVVGPVFLNSFIRDTFQSIVGRGTSDAAKRIKKLVRSSKCPRYALKIDVKKYYPSVDNEILKNEVRRKVKDKDVLWLLDDIIDSMKGLPIGNYTSQYLGNLYLNQFDWWMKQNVKPLGYFRYCDDIVVFGPSTQALVAIKKKMEEFLSGYKLTIKPTWNIYDVHKNGVDFVGFTFTPQQTRLRRTIADNFKQTCKEVKRQQNETSLNRLMAFKGWAKQSNAKKLWRKHTSCFKDVYPEQMRGAL